MTINVTLSSLGGTVSGSHSVCPNKTFNLTLNNYRGQILYWQQSKNSGASWTNIACTNAKMPSSGITATTWFRAVVSNNSCTSAYSVPSDGTDNIGFKVTVGCSSSLVVNNDRTNQSQTTIEKTTIVDTDVETLNVNGQNNVHILRGGIQVYPNPASKEALVDMTPFEGQQVTLTLTDILGKTIQQEVLTQVSATPHRLGRFKLANRFVSDTHTSQRRASVDEEATSN